MKKLLVIPFLFLVVAHIHATISDSIHPEIPAAINGEQIIHHTAYTLSYNEKYEQANWVAYELSAAETVSEFPRASKFFPDPLVKTGSADDADYAASGYDRGHLAPAADMEFSEVAAKESFYFSNVSPQVPAFNRGIWERLEEQVRSWAQEYEDVYVVTGPVLSPELIERAKYIGHDSVLVPEYFYKIVLDPVSDNEKAIAFILPNQASSLPLKNFVVSIDSVEHLTGIDFFPALDDGKENKLESLSDTAQWDWSIPTPARSGAAAVDSSSTQPLKKAVQCSAMTKKGTRCKNMTTNANGRCNVHQ